MPREYIQIIEELYNSDPQREWQRLERHRTEYAVTMRALLDHLPPAPACILDCGGGPGRYAIELSRLGYEITLFDLSHELLDIARQKSAEAQVPIAAYEQGSATDLSRFEANSFDAVLLMGPLYHLLTEENRRLALEQAYRVAKPGAPIFAAFINRYAAHRDGVAFYPHKFLANQEEYDRILESGITLPIPDKQNFVAYFAHPSEIEPLCRSAHLDVLTLIGVEGLSSMCEDKLNKLQDENWEAWVNVNYRIGHDRWIIGNTEHTLAVCLKPLWHQALIEVTSILNDMECDYCIVGGTTLTLHNLDIPVRDIDIEMPLPAAKEFDKSYTSHCTRTLQYRASDKFRSYWGSYTIGGINFDVMSGLEYCIDGDWEPFCIQRTTMQFREHAVQVNSLEAETFAYIRRGRLDRAAIALPHCNANHLNGLLRNYQDQGMF